MNGPLRINLAYYQNQTSEFRDPATQAYAHAFDFHCEPKPIIHILENNMKSIPFPYGMYHVVQRKRI